MCVFVCVVCCAWCGVSQVLCAWPGVRGGVILGTGLVLGCGAGVLGCLWAAWSHLLAAAAAAAVSAPRCKQSSVRRCVGQARANTSGAPLMK